MSRTRNEPRPPLDLTWIDDEFEITVGKLYLGTFTLHLDVVPVANAWAPAPSFFLEHNENGEPQRFKCLTFTGQRSLEPGLHGAIENAVSDMIAAEWDRIERWARAMLAEAA